MDSAALLDNDTHHGPKLSRDIDRYEWSRLGSERYAREYVNLLRPIVITDALEHWPARTKWTFDFFQECYGHLPLTVDGRDLTMAQLIREVRASSPQSPAPYLRNFPVKDLPEALQADVVPMPPCCEPNWLNHPLVTARAAYLTYKELYIGGAGAKFPVLHYDGLHTHAVLMQIHGVKEYFGFAPDQARYLYRSSGGQGNTSEIDDMENWDTSRFPLFAKAEGIRFTLHPGETLFMPAGWWHTARILSPSITISINGANSANWSAFRHDFCQFHAAGRRLPVWLINSYLMFVGQWLTMFGQV